RISLFVAIGAILGILIGYQAHVFIVASEAEKMERDQKPLEMLRIIFDYNKQTKKRQLSSHLNML
ncbi:MAG: hypothetical protein AAB215_07775, partial [Planctomycetota bacterium]